jgi:hypothetical protein
LLLLGDENQGTLTIKNKNKQKYHPASASAFDAVLVACLYIVNEPQHFGRVVRAGDGAIRTEKQTSYSVVSIFQCIADLRLVGSKIWQRGW